MESYQMRPWPFEVMLLFAIVSFESTQYIPDSMLYMTLLFSIIAEVLVTSLTYIPPLGEFISHIYAIIVKNQG